MPREYEGELEDERKRRKEEKKKLKEVVKATETAEEKRARRLEKKEKKEARRKFEGETLFGYTNENNPFGDSNLTDRFVWKKKIDQLVDNGVDPEAFTKDQQRRKQIELAAEVEKVKKRRQEREVEKARWEEEKARMQREREGLNFLDWEKKEEDFHLKQARLRSQIRLQEGRAKPVDLLCKNLALLDGTKIEDIPGFQIELHEPFRIFENLPLPDLEDLKNDLNTQLELDPTSEFWQALMVVCDDEMENARRKAAAANTIGRARSSQIDYVTDDIHRMLAAKNLEELKTRQSEILQIIQNPPADMAIEVEFYEQLLKHLSVYIAKAKLREIHRKILELHMAQLKEKEREEQIALEAQIRADQELADLEKQETEYQRQQEELQEKLKRKFYRSETPPLPQTATTESTTTADGPTSSGADVQSEIDALAAQLQQEEDNEREGAVSPTAGGGAAVGAKRGRVEGDDEEIDIDGGNSEAPKRQRTEDSEEIDLDGPPAPKSSSVPPSPPKMIGPQAPPPRAVTTSDWEKPDVGVRDEDEEEGAYSPIYIYDDELAMRAIDPAVDLQELNAKRMRVLEREAARLAELQSNAQAAGGSVKLISAEDQFVLDQRKDDSTEDMPFGGEISTDGQTYHWADKYRPRKPKYYNRVHTGFEWNKYNQTHYDHDNPPPKIVQGYKFNIFFPDLIDKTQTPTYYLEASDSPDTQIIRFHAGPPYEDVAFKIVKKEWDFSHKHGFKSSFERGILHLWFNFKRIRYRR